MNARINTLIMRGLSAAEATGQAEREREMADRIITRLRSEPDHPWHIARNADGGAAAEDFIRNAKARNERPQAEKDASRRARCLAVLAELGR